jgi:dolichol-phosphate mannosyltransferase
VVRALQRSHRNLMFLERTANRGFAASYRDGFRMVLAESWCQIVITIDADFSHDPAEIGRMLGKLENHDVVVGSRYINGGSVQNWNLRRRLLSRAANLYVRAVLRVPIRDATSGFICIRRRALESVPVQQTTSDGYAFMVELKYLLHHAGQRIVEHPISFDERREGQSKMSAGKVWESLWLPWRLRR